MKPGRVIWALICVAALAGSATTARAQSFKDQRAVVRALFAAAAKGDFQAVRDLCTGRALKYFSEHGQGIKDKAALRRMGRSLIPGRPVKIVTLAIVTLDAKQGMTPAQKAALKRIVDHLKRTAAKAKNPQAKKTILLKAAQLQRAVGQLTLRLVYLDGRWLVADAW